jgi:hypothetical protein
MTQAGLRCGALVTLLVLSTACGGSGPTSPSVRSEPTPVPGPTPQPAPNFPPLSGPSQIFIFDHQLSYSVRDYTQQSRFVLYDNGAFVLQYAICNCGGAYQGRYTEANGVITFEWEGWSTAGPWGATGTLKGDTLTVQYNLIMAMSDFEDAVYLRTP